jgi:3-hydroxybutyryl-CoA dehydrogenase
VEDVRSANMIVEAVFEDIEFKTDLLKKLNDLCPSETIIASNTSTLSITRMAATVSPSERFLGLHFFNPVPAMRLVEVIPGLQTSSEIVDTCMDFAKRIKKIPIKA